MDVQMRNLIADDEQSDALAVEGLFLGLSDPSGHRHELVEHLLVRVAPVGDLLPRYDYDMAFGHRGDVEEGDALVIGVDEGAGNLAVDDLGEQGGHGGVLLAVSDGPSTGPQNAARVSEAGTRRGEIAGDRKSTRLNSSHVAISYAVFCLKKKNRLNDRGLCIRAQRRRHGGPSA